MFNVSAEVHIGLRVPVELEQAIRLLGQRSDRSLSAEVRRALKRHVELEAAAVFAPENGNGRPTKPTASQTRAVLEPVDAD